MTPFWSMEAIVLMRVDSICCIICRKKYSWDEILVSTLNVSSNVIMTEKWRKLLLLFVFHWEMWYVQWLLANLGLSHYWGESEWTPHRRVVHEPCLYVCMSYCKYTLLQLTRSLRHWGISNSNHMYMYQSWTISLDFNGYNFKLNKDGDHLCTYLLQWQQRWWLLHDNKHGESAFSLTTNDFSKCQQW